MISVFATTFMIITRICTALLEADKIYDVTVTQSFLNRIDVLEMYFMWQKGRSQETEFQKELAQEK